MFRSLNVKVIVIVDGENILGTVGSTNEVFFSIQQTFDSE